MILAGQKAPGCAGSTRRQSRPPSRQRVPSCGLQLPHARNTRSRSAAAARQQEMCVIVDENNQVVGSATRKETVSRRLLGRGSYTLVFNAAQQLFVSKRSHNKDCYPGCLDVTISGVVNVVRADGNNSSRSNGPGTASAPACRACCSQLQFLPPGSSCVQRQRPRVAIALAVV
jgi:hypothetical protein